MLERLTNQYAITKTISIGLEPVGNTSKYIVDVIKKDKEMSLKVEAVKELVDRYHSEFISVCLSDRAILNDNILHDYCEAIANKDKKAVNNCISIMANKINAVFSASTFKIKNKEYRIVDMLSNYPDKALFHLLPESSLYTEEEKEQIMELKGCGGAFKDYFDNRKTLYNCDVDNMGKCVGGSVLDRLLSDNLPRYLSNIVVFEKVADKIGASDDLGVFTVDGFNLVLSQGGIDDYNDLIGGISLADGTRIQGFNELINLYNQHIDKSTGEKPLPLFNVLYKLPLIKNISASFVFDRYDTVEDVVDAVTSLSSLFSRNIFNEFENKFFTNVNLYSWDSVFVPIDKISDISLILTSEWHNIEDKWNDNYDSFKSEKAKSKENYAQKRRKEFTNMGSLSVADICNLLDIIPDKFLSTLNEYFTIKCSSTIMASVPLSVIKRKSLSPFKDDEKLAIKVYLDNLKVFEKFIGIFDLSEGDPLFVNTMTYYKELFGGFNGVYNKIRNFCTKKPYNASKMKLTMNNPKFLEGWSVSNEQARRSFMLKKGKDYFLAIASNLSGVRCIQTESDSEHFYEKMAYNQIPDAAQTLPRMFFSKNYVKANNIPSSYTDIINKHRGGGTYTPEEEQTLISYYKKQIANYTGWEVYNFKFKDKYNSLNDFLSDVNSQGYAISFIHISKDAVDNMVESGDILLFRIFNKSMSKHSHGRDGVYTRYFKALFDKNNRRGESLQLKGGASMYYRPASLSANATHKKNQPIKNKICRDGKEYSTFNYDLVKDKRFTEDKFILTLCIGINCNCGKNYSYVLNQNVRDIISEDKHHYIIGISRGVRNLVYVTVINEKGDIIESRSLNVIDGVDYLELLEKREAERMSARKSWGSIASIANLKEGYVGKCVNEICKLVADYDALIAFDNISTGRKQSNVKIEKNVYQKIQSGVITKLNYLWFKDVAEGNVTSLTKGIQCTNLYSDVKDLASQNGIVFFLSSYGISGLDNDTGFYNLYTEKYKNMASYKSYLDKFNDISYDSSLDMFRFDLDYKNFINWKETPCKTVWSVYSNGERSEAYRDKRSGMQKVNRVDLTNGLKDLFSANGIDYRADGLKEKIMSVSVASFYRDLARFIGLMFKTVNSDKGVWYVISPVLNSKGEFFDSRNATGNQPDSPDANASYNIARKCLISIDKINANKDDNGACFVTGTEWLDFVVK